MSKTTGWVILFAIVIALAAVTYLGGRFTHPAPGASPAPAQTPVPIANPFGTVTAKSADSFTLRGTGEALLIVYITPQTQFFGGTGAKSAADVAVGSTVSVASSTPNADGSVTAYVIQILPPRPMSAFH